MSPEVVESSPERVLRVQPEIIAEVDVVRLYLTEIGKVPLLTADEEIELGRGIQAGFRAADLISLEDEAGVERLPDETRRLEEAVEVGKEAEKRMWESNLRLVVSIAKKYAPGKESMELLDLVQEGNIGLKRAVEKFDPEKGFKFSTYASWWIRQGIKNGVANLDRMIRVPRGMLGQIAGYDQVVAEMDGLDIKDPAARTQILEDMGFDQEKVVKLERHKDSTLSTNAIVGDEHESELQDFIADNSQSDSFELYHLDVVRIVNSTPLTEQEKQVVYLRFGIVDGEPKTFEEVGSHYNVTKQRAQQIEATAMRKLRLRGEELSA